LSPICKEYEEYQKAQEEYNQKVALGLIQPREEVQIVETEIMGSDYYNLVEKKEKQEEYDESDLETLAVEMIDTNRYDAVDEEKQEESSLSKRMVTTSIIEEEEYYTK